MKIVIDIDEKYLNSNIIDVTLFTGANNTITDVNVENEYAEFQVLPKGHGRLIDENDISLIILEDSLHLMKWEKGSEVNCVIEAPTIIEADK